MTTGRINQVTILPGRHPAEARAAGTTPKGGRVVGRLGAGPGTEHPAWGIPGARSRREAAGYPIAPTEFPKKRSAPGTAPGPLGPPAAWSMRCSSGGYLPPVTSRRTVAGFGWPPNA